MDADNLVRMANRIGDFFEAMPDREEALEGIATHIRKFWEPRMRRQFFEMLDCGSAEFNELVVAASAKIRRPNAPEGPGFSVEVERGWSFLRPYLEGAGLFVFSRAVYAPHWVQKKRLVVIPPNIDPFSTKNQELTPAEIRSNAQVIGLPMRRRT